MQSTHGTTLAIKTLAFIHQSILVISSNPFSPFASISTLDQHTESTMYNKGIQPIQQ